MAARRGTAGQRPLAAEAGAEADGDTALPAFARDVLAGLSAQPKSLPCKYFYDTAGSQLFERICTLPEYYPTRTERAILIAERTAIGAALPEGLVVIEPGGGSCEKIGLLLPALRRPRAFVAIDISAAHVHAAADGLGRSFPGLYVAAVAGDFAERMRLPRTVPVGPRLVFFPGSTIGNFHPPDAAALLGRFVRELGAAFILIGVDLQKDRSVLEAAYDDGLGVTAAFNLNLLARANRELGADFRLSGFAHRAAYNAAAGRIEIHLVSRERQSVRLLGRSFDFAAGEAIHTENSYKYTIMGFAELATSAGLTPAAVWTDPQRLFSLHLLAAA